MPSGWPRAMAPPLGFTCSASSARPSCRMTANPWAAKASFNSTTSMSDIVSPSRCKSFSLAGAGPMPMMRGATPATAVPRMRAIGVRPKRSTAACEAMMSAAAPSLTPDALPAVTVPFCRNGVVRLASFSRLVVRGCSSVSKRIGSPRRCGRDIGVISRANRPEA